MIACVHGWGFPLKTALREIPGCLEPLPRLGQIRDEAEIDAVVHRVWSDAEFAGELRAQLVDAVDHVQQSLDVLSREAPAAAGQPGLSLPERERFLGAAALGPEGEGLRRVIYQIETKFGAYRTANVQGKGDGLDLRPQQIRVPTTDANPAEGMLFWVEFLRSLVPVDMPVLLTGPVSGDWLDITVGELSADQLTCLRVTPKALPPASCIPFELDPQVRERSDAAILAFLRGEPIPAPKSETSVFNRKKAAAPPPPTAPENPPPSDPVRRSPWLLKTSVTVAVLALVGVGGWYWSVLPPNTVDKPPLAAGQSASVDAGASISITLQGSDPEGTPLTYRIISQPAQGTLRGNAPELIYEASPTARGMDRITFVVSDGQTESRPAEVTFRIGVPAPPPEATAQNLGVAADEALAITLSGVAAENATLTYTIVTWPQYGVLAGTPPRVNYQPGPGASGTDRFSFKVSNGQQDSSPAEVSIRITAPSPPPVALGQRLRVIAGEVTPITLQGSDPGGMTLKYVLLSKPGQGDLAGDPPALRYQARSDADGTDGFAFKVNNGRKDSASAEITIDILPAILRPIASNLVLSVEAGKSITFELAGADPEKAALTYRVVEKPKQGDLSGVPPSVTYRASAKALGTDSFVFLANNGARDSTPATVTIKIQPAPANQPPVASNQIVRATAGETLKITLVGGDPENAALSYRVINGPSQGALSGIAPNLTYRAREDARGMDRFTFLVSDGSQSSRPAEVVLEIQEAPAISLTASSQTVTVEAGGSVVVTLKSGAAKSAALTYRVIDPPKKGTLAGTPPALRYRAEADARGTDRFQFVVSDGRNESAPADVTITINPTETASQSRQELDHRLTKLESVYQDWKGQRFWPESVYNYIGTNLVALANAYRQGDWLDAVTQKRFEALKRDSKVRDAIAR
jgi:hypothetical protein